MRKFWIFSGMIAMFAFAGCSHQTEAVKPASAAESKFKLSVNVEEAAPASVPEKKSGKASARPKKKSQVKRPQSNPAAKSKVNVPPPGGAIDVELNNVERSYVQEVRSRHQRQSEESARQVFGGFSVEGLIKGQ
jgi:hypothetical protein